MKNMLKKLLVASLIASPIIISNTTNVSAYSEEAEELAIPYQTSKAAITKASGQNDEFTVVIDAGHGGSDSGAVNKTLNISEKNLNIDIAKAIQKRLSSYGINVIMTRTDDRYLALGERTQLANVANADLFISAHNDTPEGNGDGSHIIHSIHDRNGGISKTLATNIGNSIKSNTTQNLKASSPIWSRYYPDRNDLDYYYVIRETNMPAVIVEHSYMNANDIKAVDTVEKREIMGNAVADGIYKTINENFKGWTRVKTKWKYYDSATKIKKVGWLKDADKWYYLDSTGEMQTGWESVNGKWYYLDGSGAMKTGWLKDNNKWYYLEGSGAMLTGWVKDNGKWYYLDKSGAMQTGWESVNGTWYYLEGSGAMKTGWLKDNNVWYYLNTSGAMQIGWLEDQGNKYYLTESGAMKTGWLIHNNEWYYFAANGAMLTGWLELGEKTYYLDENGVMKTGTVIIDGEEYYFNDNGELKNNNLY